MNPNMRRLPRQRQAPRGTPNGMNSRQQYERYLARAREAQVAGDAGRDGELLPARGAPDAMLFTPSHKAKQRERLADVYSDNDDETCGSR